VSRPKSPKTRSRTSPPKPSRTEAVPPAFSFSAVANQYARDVVERRILACKWVLLACKRHLDDLVRAKRGWNYIFDEAKANRACRFIECLPHTKGDWAARGQKIKLEPWQVFIICVLFGWLKAVSRTRRFSIAYIAVPRKNGKSILAGGIGNYMFAADGEFGAEVYCGATTEKQAWEVFRPAKQMVERTPELAEAFGIDPRAKTMVVEANGSRFEPVIGKPGDGASPHCAIVDEYHEHDDDTQWDTFRTGMGARRQPLLLGITTAGTNLAGPCKALQGDAEQVLEGSIEREELFAIVFTIDAGDDWTSEEALRKANPNYDVSVSADFLRTEQRAAIANARKQSIFRTKHLNIWDGANSAFFNIQKWNTLADKSLNPDEFRGLVCVAAVDLSSKKDLTARVLVFKKSIQSQGENGKPLHKDHYYIFGHFYLPANRAAQPEFQHYQGWVVEGHLKTTPGGVIDYDTITEDTVRDVQQFRIKELCFDPWNAEQFAQTVAKQAKPVTAIEVPQQPKFLSEPMKQLDALILDGRVHHDGNPVLTWMMGNVTAHTDAKDNVFPRKERDENKIDGAVALITAMYRALLTGGPSKSVYSTRGLLTL
jgi:phage terminase large subunit-like protein